MTIQEVLKLKNGTKVKMNGDIYIVQGDLLGDKSLYDEEEEQLIESLLPLEDIVSGDYIITKETVSFRKLLGEQKDSKEMLYISIEQIEELCKLTVDRIFSFNQLLNFLGAMSDGHPDEIATVMLFSQEFEIVPPEEVALRMKEGR